jgi:alanine dehydrogenase
MPLLLSNDDVVSLLTMSDCLTAVEASYRELGTGQAVSRPRSDMTVPRPDPGRYYWLKTFDAVLPGVGLAAVRLTSNMVQESTRDGLRRMQAVPLAPGSTYVGLVLLFRLETTELVAIIQDARIQVMRAGATQGLAAKLVARPDATVLGLFGSGQMAREGLTAIALVRDLKLVKVFSPTRANRERFARTMSDRLGVEVRAVDGPREVVDGSDIVATATTSLDPVFSGEWLEPGQHVNTINNSEVDDLVRRRASLIVRQVADQALQWMPAAERDRNRTGARTRAGEGQQLDPGRAPLLQDLVLGRHPGRVSAEEITLYGGLGGYGPGTAYAAVGAIAVQRARERGIGRALPAEWFVQRESS